MIGKSIVSWFWPVSGYFRLPKAHPPDLHSAWTHPAKLPACLQRSVRAKKAVDLLGPLAWDRLPERELERNWGRPAVPHAAFIAAYLLKLDWGQKSLAELRVSLCENPELAWLLGFPPAVSNSGAGRGGGCRLPTTRHLSRMLRELPNATLQFLLADSVRLIREALAAVGVPTGECIVLDTKHVIAWVRENNPKAYLSNRYVKTQQPPGDPDCKLGCKRRHNRRAAGSEPAPGAAAPTPSKNPFPGSQLTVGEFYWGYASGVAAVKAPGWGEFVLAELTQTFDRGDITYFFPLMAQVEQRLGFRPRWGAFDAAFDAWYVYEYFHRPDDPACFAAVAFSEKGVGQVKDRRFTPEGLPICAAGLAMPLKVTYTDRTRSLMPHERGRHVCPLIFPQPTQQECPIQHKNWAKKGCTVDMPTSAGARLRYTLDRSCQAYKDVYKQRTAVERINSQAVALGIERPHLRNAAAIANQNTLIYILINLRFLQRILKRRGEIE